MLEKKNFYINGKWVGPKKPNDIMVVNPATEKSCAVISLAGKEDVNDAVLAALWPIEETLLEAKQQNAFVFWNHPAWSAEQENAECNEEIEKLHPDYLHLDPEYIDNMEENNNMAQNIYRKIDLPDIKILKQKQIIYLLAIN